MPSNTDVISHKTPPISMVNITDIIRDHTKNFRDEDNYHVAELVNDIRDNGQRQAMRLEKRSDGKYDILAGNRRGDALYHLATNNNPETGKPYIDPQTDKPFQFVKAEVYKDLTGAQRWQLQFDHGTTRGLSKPEFVRAIWSALDQQIPDRRVVSSSFALFMQFFPPKRAIEDNENAYLEYWKGALQSIKQAWKGPTLVREAYLAKMRGQQKWPGKAELAESVKIYETALKEDRTNSINRNNPGPKFMEYWNKLVAAKAEADAEGDEEGEGNGKPRPVSAMNRTDMEGLKNTTDSRILKTALSFNLRDLPKERWAGFDKFCVGLEATLTPEQVQMLDAINGAEVPAPTEEQIAAVAANQQETVGSAK